MLTFEVIGDKAVIARIGQMPAALRAALEVKVKNLAIKLQGWIQTKKLQGQVLNHVTGALSRSIQHDVQTMASAVLGMVFSAGDVKYAAFWEFGFKGSETVRAHTRQVSQVFGRSVPTYTQQVGEYSRNVDQPARPFMRPSLREMTPEIEQTIRDTVLNTARAQVLGD